MGRRSCEAQRRIIEKTLEEASLTYLGFELKRKG
jgi:hypothetical protein